MKLVTMVLVALLASSMALAQEDHLDLQRLAVQGQSQEVLDQALERLEASPDDLTLLHLAGRSLAELGRNDEARPYLERCIDSGVEDWRYSWSLFYLGGVEISQGDAEGARQKWIEVRDSKITQNLSRNAAGNLLFFGLDESFDDWPRRQTEHLRIVFSPAHSELDLDGWAENHERAWGELTREFGSAPEYPVRYIVWGDIPEATQMAGIRNLGFAKPQYNLVHCLWPQTVGHELAHVVSYHALHPTVTTRFINEGIAVAHDLTGRDRIELARYAMGEAGIESVDLRSLWMGEDAAGDELLYPVSGAWIWFLIDREGREKFTELAKDQTIESAAGIYGQDFDGLVGEFEGLLND